MIESRRLLVGTLCVEGVAAVAALTYGHLSLVAVAVLYWIDLLFLMLRAAVQQLLSRPVTDREVPFQVPFRLLAHKRGSLAVTERLPPVYPRNVPGALGVVLVLLISTATTAYVAVVEVPSAFWSEPATPFVLAGGVVAAATKSWLALRAHVESGVHRTAPAYVTSPGKRALTFAVYAAPLWLVSRWTATTLAQDGMAVTRAGMTVVAAVVIASRVAYGVYASYSGVDDGGSEHGQTAASTDSADGLASRVRSALSGERAVFVPSPPSVPDEAPLETTTPDRRSVLAAGFVNAVTTGGVVDGQFGHWRQLTLRIGLVGVVVVAVLALFDGAIVVSVALTGVVLGSVAALSVASAVHMLLALDGVEYRFYRSEMVAYDRYLGEPQWAASYDSVGGVSVERDLFGSPLWLDAGTVCFDRAGGPDQPTFTQQEPRASVAFVPNAERVGEILRARGERQVS